MLLTKFKIYDFGLANRQLAVGEAYSSSICFNGLICSDCGQANNAHSGTQRDTHSSAEAEAEAGAGVEVTVAGWRAEPTGFA